MDWLTSRRHVVMLAAALVAVPVTVGQLLLEQSGPTRALWQLLCAAVVPLVAVSLERGRKPLLEVVPAVLAAIGPLCMLADGVTATDRTVVVLIPVVMAVFFFERFRVVVSVLVLGTVSVGWFSYATGASPAEVATVVVSVVGVGLVEAITSHWLSEARERELTAEQQRSQALRLSETRRSQAERLAIVGRLASGVAHEINNPLAYVKANIGVLRRELFGPGGLSELEAKEILDETQAGIERICQIVADLKSFAREGTDELEPVDLRELIDGATRLASVRLPAGVRVTVEVRRGLLVRANRRKLAQVVLNLLVNAGEALEEARVSQPRITVSASMSGDGVLLTVEDNGPGLPDAVLARLFEPFFTTKDPGKGTGLGLALSREYLSGFGGTIRAQNLTPSGARFLVTLRAPAVTGETPLPGRLVA